MGTLSLMYQFSDNRNQTEVHKVNFDFLADMPSNLGNMMSIQNRVRDPKIHYQLKADLVENI